MVGPAGVGKTTLLRDAARLLSGERGKGGLGLSTVVVDTHNEVAGDSDQPPPCIGRARRHAIPDRMEQWQVGQ